MGNFNYFGKSFKGSIFGGDKTDRSEKKSEYDDKNKKA